MSFWSRLANIFRAKAHKAIDAAEDPGESLDYAYQRQLELLSKVRKGVVDVAASRKRVDLQIAELEKNAAKLADQAQRAIEAGREDLAREALTRKAALAPQLEQLKAQRDAVLAEEEKLIRAQQQLQAKVDAFRIKKETVKAQYGAAKAQTQINDALSGLGGEMSDVAGAITRAEDKTAQMQARAGAVDELLASGALDSPALGMGGDSIDRELNEIAAASTIEDELAALKAQAALPASQPILRQIEG